MTKAAPKLAPKASATWWLFLPAPDWAENQNNTSKHATQLLEIQKKKTESRVER